VTNDELHWFRRVYVSIFSKFNVTVGRHTMMRNSCITVPAEGKNSESIKTVEVEFSEDVWLAKCFKTSWRKTVSMFGSINNKTALLLHLTIAEVEVLVCRADRTTKLLLNQANVNRAFQYQKFSESKVLVCKVIVRMCCNCQQHQKNCLLKRSIRQ
jgi:hypothetical protein